MTNLHIHGLWHGWWRSRVLEDLWLFPFNDSNSLTGTVLTRRCDAGGNRMTKEFDGGNPHAEDLWVRGGLEALVGDQGTSRIQ